MTDTLLYWKAPDGTRTRDLLITNQSLYQLSHGSALNRTILWYQRQRVLSREKWKFTRYVTKALRCNDFVAGPVSLQLTGHPFAKPHVPCVVASQLCFVHERASTSSCWSVKFLCKHEICPDLAWRVNCNSNSAGSFYVPSYYTLLWKTYFKCLAREIHSPSGLAAILVSVNFNSEPYLSLKYSSGSKVRASAGVRWYTGGSK